jgi:uncharacterized protein YndB with AHSA1/START domain
MRTGTHDITLEHVLDAPPAAVFDMYVDPAADRIIFAGGPDWTVEVACEVRLGALWTTAIGARGGPAYHEINRFTAIDRPGHLAVESTLTMPDGAKLDREVDVTRTSMDGAKTRMSIVQICLPSAESAEAFGAAFTGVFARLEQMAQARLARYRHPRGTPQ